MNIEKTIKICDKDVILRYCAGAETGYEILAEGKSSEVFAPTVAEKDENGKPVKYNPPKATADDYIKLATAAIVAAYDYRSEENHVVKPPVSTKDILFSASPAEACDRFQRVVGEIGTDWFDYLYRLAYWQIMLIERGYYRRNVLLYQLLRENIFASAFCMGGNKSGKTSSDLLPLYLDRYKTGDDAVLTDEERDELQAEMDAMNAAIAETNKK